MEFIHEESKLLILTFTNHTNNEKIVLDNANCLQKHIVKL